MIKYILGALLLTAAAYSEAQVIVTRPPTSCIQTCSPVTGMCITQCN